MDRNALLYPPTIALKIPARATAQGLDQRLAAVENSASYPRVHGCRNGTRLGPFTD